MTREEGSSGTTLCQHGRSAPRQTASPLPHPGRGGEGRGEGRGGEGRGGEGREGEGRGGEGRGGEGRGGEGRGEGRGGEGRGGEGRVGEGRGGEGREEVSDCHPFRPGQPYLRRGADVSAVGGAGGQSLHHALPGPGTQGLQHSATLRGRTCPHHTARLSLTRLDTAQPHKARRGSASLTSCKA